MACEVKGQFLAFYSLHGPNSSHRFAGKCLYPLGHLPVPQRGFVKIFFIIIFSYVYVSVFRFVYLSAGAHRGQKLDPQELETVVSHLTWLLGSKLGSSGRVEYVINH